jgi:parvulin-like peptidyl-prolyl isomerase
VRRFLFLIALVVAAGLLVAGCSNGRSLAASYNSTDVTQRALNDDLEALAKSKELRSQLESQQNIKLQPSKGTFNSTLAANWLASLVRQAVVDDEVESRHLKVTATDREKAKQSITSQLFTQGIFDEFPKSFQNRLVEREAKVEILQASLAKEAKVTEAQIEDFYAKNKDQLCASGKLLYAIAAQSQADAAAAVTEIRGGKSFGDVAKERSADSTTGQRGGLAGCVGSLQLPAEIQTVVTALADGAVSEPVASSNTYYVLQVQPLTVERIHDQIEQQLRQNSSVQAFTDKKLKAGKVWVDPRYGTKSFANSSFTIKPPVAKSPKSRPSKSSTTTSGPAGSATTAPGTPTSP